MVKRYYCDFCDCSYPYSTEAFRRHRSGHHHVKLRRAHYDKFKNARERLWDEANREKCRKFMSGQECSFGDSCIFSHSTPAAIEALKHQAEEEQRQERMRRLPSALSEGRDLSLEAWLKQRRTPLTEDAPKGPSHDPLETLTFLTDPLPLSLAALPRLPPSLAPVTPESCLDVEFAHWG